MGLRKRTNQYKQKLKPPRRVAWLVRALRFLCRLRKVLWIVTLLVLCYVGGEWVYATLTSPQYLSIRYVHIHVSNPYLPKSRVNKLIQRVMVGGFFSLNEQGIRAALLGVPWVKSVSLRRIWPRTLRATIVAYWPVARWNTVSVLSRTGIVFTPQPSTMPANLVSLQGPVGDASTVFLAYQHYAQMLKKYQFSVSALTETARGAWLLQLSNGVLIRLGRTHMLGRLKRLMLLYANIKVPSGKHIDAIDLRYPDGFAVSFRSFA